MTRRQIPNKQKAILDAAINIFAERSFWNTPTSLISKTAGIADGTLFTYFKTKDELITEVYLEIKHDLGDYLMETSPVDSSFKEFFRHVWHGYIEWALHNPAKFAVLQQINSSFTLHEKVHIAGAESFHILQEMACKSIAEGELQPYPVDYLAIVMDGMIVTTIRFIVDNPDCREEAKHNGFEILWKGVTTA